MIRADWHAANGARLGIERDPCELEAERSLLSAVRERQPKAGERLYDALVATVARTIVRTLGHGQAEHDDLVQATFEQLILSLADGTFRHECSLKSWAGSIASHLALNVIRSRRRERAVFDKGRSIDNERDVRGAVLTERAVDSRRTIERVRTELGAMNEERARALVLFHVQEYDLRQVATALGITVAAAQSRVARGRRELLERIQRIEEAGGV
jgi:RNA polymerase sigma-70 factor, ECF subfamily